MPKSYWKMKDEKFLTKEQRFLQEQAFHRMRIKLTCDINESHWTPRQLGDVIESLRWLDEKNGRPVSGYEGLRSWLVANRGR